WESLQHLPCRKATLDGEIVALDDKGHPSFELLQDLQGSRRQSGRVFYYAFDILNCEAKDLKGLPIEDRRMVLEQLLKKAPTNIRFSKCLEGAANAIVEAVEAHGLEGIVAKRSGSRYEVGQRSGAWI